MDTNIQDSYNNCNPLVPSIWAYTELRDLAAYKIQELEHWTLEELADYCNRLDVTPDQIWYVLEQYYKEVGREFEKEFGGEDAE